MYKKDKIKLFFTRLYKGFYKKRFAFNTDNIHICNNIYNYKRECALYKHNKSFILVMYNYISIMVHKTQLYKVF